MAVSPLASPPSYDSPWRWFWLDDKQTFQPYGDEINSLIEEAYFQHGKKGAYTTEPIRRFVDDVKQRYVIDFDRFHQINCGTGFKRSIKREKTRVLAYGNVIWYFEQGFDSWKPYSVLVSGTIEEAYRAYVEEGGPSCRLGVQFPDSPDRYNLDFVLGKQTNIATNMHRSIRRAVSAGPGPRLPHAADLVAPQTQQQQTFQQQMDRLQAQIVQQPTPQPDQQSSQQPQHQVTSLQPPPLQSLVPPPLPTKEESSSDECSVCSNPISNRVAAVPCGHTSVRQLLIIDFLFMMIKIGRSKFIGPK